jgi:hypothetical protein
LGATAPDGPHSFIIDASALATGNGFNLSSDYNRIEGLTIANAPENGIAVEGVAADTGRFNTFSNNLIYGNGDLAIDLNIDGVTINDGGDGDDGANQLLNYPDIDSVFSQPDATFMIYGRAEPASIVEFFVAHPAGDTTRPANALGHGDAYAFAGSTTASALGDFSFHDTSSSHFTMLTCAATDTLGNTSELSSNFKLLPRPLIVVAYTYDPAKGGFLPQNGINIIVEDPNGDLFGRDPDNVPIDEIPGDQYYFDTPNDSVIIPEPIVGDYIINFIAENGSSTGSLYAGIIKIDGSLECTIIINDDIPSTGQMESLTYTYDEEGHYTNGDANGDGDCNVGDAVFVINYVFKGGPPPVPELSADANCDGTSNVGDAVYVINFVFKGGDPPCYFEM